MRTLRRRRWPQQANRLTVVVAVADGEQLGGVGDRINLEEIGVCRVLAIRQTDVPEAGPRPGERVLALDVQSLETSGDVPDIS